MPKVNRRVASQILLAALDFKEGNRSAAAKRLALAAEDPDFEDTVDGMGEGTDPFINEQADGEDDGSAGAGDGDGADDLDLNGLDDLLDNQEASLARNGKRRGAPRTATEEDDKIGGNDGPAGADKKNDSDEEIRQEASLARNRQVRANLMALAKVR